MHLTLRIAIQAGTPTHDLRDPHVYVEAENEDALVYALNDIGATARSYLGDHPDATWDSLRDRLIVQHTTGADDMAAREDTPWGRDTDSIAQALSNLEMVEDRLHRWSEAARHRELAGGEPADEELSGALADLQQACRFLRDEEVPS